MSKTTAEIKRVLIARGRPDLARALGVSVAAAADMESLKKNWKEILTQQNTIPAAVKGMRSLGPERFHFILSEMLFSLGNVLALANMKSEAEALRKISIGLMRTHKTA